MQSYISDTITITKTKSNQNSNPIKLIFVLKKKKIDYVVNNDIIKIKFPNFDSNFLIYHNNYSPQFIVMEQNEKNISIEQMDQMNQMDQMDQMDQIDNTTTNSNPNQIIMNICEDINMNIDEYDCIEDIVCKIEMNIAIAISIANQIKIQQKNNLASNVKKNIKKFNEQLEQKKQQYIDTNKNSHETKLIANKNLFSTRAYVEMLGDQIIKIFSNEKFNVKFDDFPNILIFMNGFTFKGSYYDTKTNKNFVNLEVQINMEISLNNPTQPPKIKLNSNKILKDNILQVITQLKPFSDINSWSIKYSIYDSIVNIYNMINTFGEIQQEYTSELDKLVNDLEYLLSIKSQNISEKKLLEMFDKDLVSDNKILSDTKTSAQQISTQTQASTTDKWKKGTGYGFDGLKPWDIDSYIKNVNDKKKKITKKFNKLIKLLHNKFLDSEIFNNNLKQNVLLEQIINLLISYMDMDFDCDSGVSAGTDAGAGTGTGAGTGAGAVTGTDVNSEIILILNIIYKNFTKLNTSYCVVKFHKLLDLVKNYSYDNNITHELFTNTKLITTNITNTDTNKSSDPFINMFNQYGFVMYSNNFKNFYYEKLTPINPEKISRIKKEFNIIKKSLTINSEASIFFTVEKNNLNKMKFIITGPVGTPYEQGLYIFDMTLSKEFPTKPPFVHFSNNGGKRFNPNLYNCGKVCLSLLGTWRGDKGESWNSTTSTFFQILVSIQSQILIEEPYFNEPGHESSIGKPNGIINSKNYNDKIRLYNLDHAINELIENAIKFNPNFSSNSCLDLNKNSESNYPEFNNIILNYFKFKKDKILDMLDKWEIEYKAIDTSKDKDKNNSMFNSFKKSKEKFINLINKL